MTKINNKTNIKAKLKLYSLSQPCPASLIFLEFLLVAPCSDQSIIYLIFLTSSFMLSLLGLRGTICILLDKYCQGQTN